MAKDRDLVDERARFLLAMDAAYPDVGIGLVPYIARQRAVEQLKHEGKIAVEYVDDVKPGVI